MSVTEPRSVLGERVEQPVVGVDRPRRRQTTWMLGGVLLAVLGGLVAAWLFSSSVATAPVLVAAVDLEPGRPVVASDFRVVDVGRDEGVSSVGADDQAVVLGEVPRFVIPAGTMVSREMFMPVDALVPDGSAVLSVVVEVGAVPASLASGERVLLIDVDPDTEGVISEADVLVVSSLERSGGEERRLVTLLVAQDVAVRVASAAHDGVLVLGSLG